MSNRPGGKVAAQQARGRVQSGPGQQTQSKNTTRFVLIGVGVAVALAIALGIALAPGDDGGETGLVEVGFAETIGDPLPPFGAGPDAAIGRPAPTIRAQDMYSGDVVEVAPGDGSVHVIGFFTHWCSHCQREVPAVTNWAATNEVPAGVEVIAISTSVDQGAPNYPPSAWFSREGWPFGVLSDTEQGAVAQGYGLSAFPYWVVVAPDGTVAERVSGEMETAAFSAFMARAGALAS